MRSVGLSVMVVVGVVVMACSSTDSGGASSGGNAGGGTGGAATGGASGGGASGTGGVGGSTGDISALCTSACEKMAAAQCPAESSATVCKEECADSLGSLLDTCGSAVTGYLSCAATTGSFSCDNEGLAVLDGCDPAKLALEHCIVCAADPQDDPCEQCIKQSCCTQMGDFYADPQVDAYGTCMLSCADDACRQDCASQYPATAAAEAALGQCMQDHCSATCTN